MPPISAFQNKCISLLDAGPRNHATHSFRSALHHLERAEALRDIDPAMAAFRAITAEEEAASGVMRCLQNLGYSGADFLNPHNHTHKHAVFPFLQVLQLFFSQTLALYFQKYNLHIKEEDGVTRLTLALDVLVDGAAQLVYPVPPLNFHVRNFGTETPVDYQSQIDQFLAAKGKATIREFLRNEANLRNRILYADKNGYPTISSLGDHFLVERKARVWGMIYLYLLVYPYAEHQPFVSQALGAFVKLLDELKRT